MKITELLPPPNIQLIHTPTCHRCGRERVWDEIHFILTDNDVAVCASRKLSVQQWIDKAARESYNASLAAEQGKVPSEANGAL